MTTTGDRAATVCVLRGTPSGAEVAALVVVLAALASRRRPDAPEPRRGWADPVGLRGEPPRPGAGAWRSSGLPS
jgi:hypothetical protein